MGHIGHHKGVSVWHREARGVCDGRQIIKRGLRKNSFRQLQIYWLQGLRRVRTG
jgi:hypothetical protein